MKNEVVWCEVKWGGKIKEFAAHIIGLPWRVIIMKNVSVNENTQMLLNY